MVDCEGESSGPSDVGDDHRESDLGVDADSEASDTDEEYDVRVNGQPVEEPSINTRCTSLRCSSSICFLLFF